MDRDGIEESPHRVLTGVKLDKKQPEISILSPLNGSQIGSSTATVTWAGSDETSGIDHYETRLDGGSWTTSGTDTTRVFSGLWDGRHTVEIRALDRAGNDSSVSVSFTTNTGQTPYPVVLGTFLVAVAAGAGLYLLRARRRKKS